MSTANRRSTRTDGSDRAVDQVLLDGELQQPRVRVDALLLHDLVFVVLHCARRKPEIVAPNSESRPASRKSNWLALSERHRIKSGSWSAESAA